jgi:hypothetical protein
MAKGQVEEAVAFLRRHGFRAEALGAGLWHVTNGSAQGPGPVLELELAEPELLALYRKLLAAAQRVAERGGA